MGDSPGKGFGTVVSPEGAVAPAAHQEEQELDDVVTGNDLLDSDDDLNEDLDDEAAGADEGDLSDEAGDDEAGRDDDAEGDEADDDEDDDTLEEEGDIAADYIEGLLDIADLDGDIDMDVEGDRAVVSVVGATLDELVGEDGEVLEALQELTRLAVHRKTGSRARLMLDVGGFRVRRRAELAELGRSVAEEVSRTGEPKRMRAMSPFERKIIHDAIADAGLRSESEGEEPNRRVVVFPVG